jgi:hypothetical protein
MERWRGPGLERRGACLANDADAGGFLVVLGSRKTRFRGMAQPGDAEIGRGPPAAPASPYTATYA